MKPDRTANQRQSRARQALAESGGRTVTVKLDKSTSEALAVLCERFSVDQQTVVRCAVQELRAHTEPATVESIST